MGNSGVWGKLIHEKNRSRKSRDTVSLKVPKCEIFDCLDFHDFYTLKSLREGDFVG